MTKRRNLTLEEFLLWEVVGDDAFLIDYQACRCPNWRIGQPCCRIDSKKLDEQPNEETET